MQQAIDFLDETMALADLVAPLADNQFEQSTQFKGWTIDNILRHLHVWNIAADVTLTNEAAFSAFLNEMMAGVSGGRLPDFEERYLGGLSGQALRAAWVERAMTTSAHFALADPKMRLKWVGPEMSALSSITARLMETWAHAQAIYDLMGAKRIETDRISNIVRLGINTWAWTWKNRRMDAPGPMPRVRLVAPSGALWEYGEGTDLIEGSAPEFCQVVTQCRNITDTSLKVEGDIARQWMAVAQCFAGPPRDPPPPGSRFVKVT